MMAAGVTSSRFPLDPDSFTAILSVLQDGRAE